MPLYSGFCRSAQLCGTGLLPSAAVLMNRPSVPEWMVNQLPLGSLSAAGILSQPLGLYGVSTPASRAGSAAIPPR